MYADVYSRFVSPATVASRPVHRVGKGGSRNKPHTKQGWLQRPVSFSLNLLLRNITKTEQERTRCLKVSFEIPDRTIRIAVHEGTEDAVMMIQPLRRFLS
jgi:hypothetical protein